MVYELGNPCPTCGESGGYIVDAVPDQIHAPRFMKSQATVTSAWVTYRCSNGCEWKERPESEGVSEASHPQ